MSAARRSAFSLVELIVTVAIMAILCALAVPGFSLARKQMQRAAARADVKALRDAVLAYKAHYDIDPLPKTFWEQVPTEFNATGKTVRVNGDNAVTAILRGEASQADANPEGIVFLDVRRRVTSASPSWAGGMTTDGFFQDPWGNVYNLILGLRQTDEIPLPDETIVRANVVAYSVGPNGKFDGDAPGSDDVRSWR